MSVLAGIRLGQVFGGVTALRDVDVAAVPGEVLGIIGPNGSGKSTLVDVLSGITRPQQGRVELDGVDITNQSAATRARSGIMRTFQTTRLMEPLTVRDNVMLGLHVSGLRGRQRRERVDAVLGTVGITGLADVAVRELSHGQRRRVELGRALAGGPDVLILDEPTAGLFGPDAVEVCGLLRDAAAAGAAVVMVEHDLGIVGAVCTRLVALDGGEVVASGPTRAILNGAVVAALRGELGHDRAEAV